MSTLFQVATIIESLAYGVPVCASAVGGIPEMYDEGVEGRFIPLDNPETAATLIQEWLDSPDEMRRARVAARERFLNSFEEFGVAERLIRFLDS